MKTKVLQHVDGLDAPSRVKQSLTALILWADEGLPPPASEPTLPGLEFFYTRNMCEYTLSREIAEAHFDFECLFRENAPFERFASQIQQLVATNFCLFFCATCGKLLPPFTRSFRPLAGFSLETNELFHFACFLRHPHRRAMADATLPSQIGELTADGAKILREDTDAILLDYYSGSEDAPEPYLLILRDTLSKFQMQSKAEFVEYSRQIHEYALEYPYPEELLAARRAFQAASEFVRARDFA